MKSEYRNSNTSEKNSLKIVEHFKMYTIGIVRNRISTTESALGLLEIGQNCLGLFENCLQAQRYFEGIFAK